MKLYQLLGRKNSIPAGSYVTIQESLPDSEGITIKVGDSTEKVPMEQLSLVTWEPNFCKFLVDYMGAIEEAEYEENMPDSDEGTDRLWCTVDLNHPECPVDDLEERLVDYWSKGIHPLYIILRY